MANNELKVLIGMSRALREINQETASICKKYNLTIKQFSALEALYHKGSLTVGEISEKILCTTGTIPVILKNLERDGLIIRTQDDVDRRKYFLQISQKGIDLMDKMYPENEAALCTIINRWTDEEQTQLVYLMKKFGGK